MIHIQPIQSIHGRKYMSETSQNKPEKTKNPLGWVIGAISTALAFLILYIIGNPRKLRNALNRDAGFQQPTPSKPAPDHPNIQPAIAPTAKSAPKAPLKAETPDVIHKNETVTWSSTTKYLVAVALFLFFLVLIYISRNVIPLIILGALIAFTIQPLINAFQQKMKLKRGFAISLTYLLVLLLILLIPLILIPSIINVIDLVTQIDFQATIQNLTDHVVSFHQQVSSIQLIGPILDSLFSPLIESLQKVTAAQPQEALNLNIAFDQLVTSLASTLGVLVRAGGAVVSASVAVFFSLFISIYLSFDAYKMRTIIPRLMPPDYNQEIQSLITRLGRIWDSFLRGQITLMIFIGIVVWLGAVILGLPQPVFFGFLSGTLEMIPSLGPLLAFIPAVTVALIFGSTHFAISNLTFALLVAIFYLLVQFMENQFIVPRILGKAVDLHPLVVLVGALAAGSQFGILGIFLAAPMIASGKEIIIYLYDKILETPPGPAPVEQKSFWKDVRAFASRSCEVVIRPFRRFML